MCKNKERSISNRFRKEVREKMEELYVEEQSLHAVYKEQPDLIEIVEYYDEDCSEYFLNMLEEEVNQFKNNNKR